MLQSGAARVLFAFTAAPIGEISASIPFLNSGVLFLRDVSYEKCQLFYVALVASPSNC